MTHAIISIMNLDSSDQIKPVPWLIGFQCPISRLLTSKHA